MDVRHACSALFLLLMILGGTPLCLAGAEGRDISDLEVLSHDWRPDEVWGLIGKTKFVWRATVRNNSDRRKRVYVYYDLLDAENVPAARAVANRYIDPHQKIEIISDSYIISSFLPKIKNSRVTLKVGFPN
ncbi:MAG TPA: hypothetical protein VI382_04585 [Candidatus Manganitrophaceae bacterium]|nr:hypothetical protein [Candidatus Manganitrophaceae bacterium]